MEHQRQYLTPFQRKLLLKNLQQDLRPEYHRRIQIMLLADTGQSQAQICIPQQLRPNKGNDAKCSQTSQNLRNCSKLNNGF